MADAGSGLTVATPWYPVPYNRMAGAFVAEHVRVAERLVPAVRVVHGLEWPGGTPEAAQTLRPAFDAVLDRLGPGQGTAGVRVRGAVGPVDRVPVFTVGGASWAQRAQALVRDVRRAAGPFVTPLVHGHVGYLGGVLAARLADPAAKVFATEHSTALRDVLADPAAQDLYAELIDRAEVVWCVSGLLRDQVLERVADPHGRLQVLHNPVDFRGAPRRPSPPPRLDRWVFVGGLHERKGVERLVRAFCIAAREDDAVTLTLFGGGALADRLRDLAAEACVADRLHLLGVVPHAEVLARLPEFDVLVAPSTYETFHLAVTEAVAAGVPVIVTRSGGPQESLAGVEHLVGRFVDVEDAPDQLVDAWRELAAGLEGLDLDAARQQLDARYGVEAVAARLAQAYGVDVGVEVGVDVGVGVGVGVQTLERPESVGPQRIVILATSGWRRYSVETELARARELNVPTAVVTTDPQITGWAAGLSVVPPKAVPLDGAPPPAAPAQSLAVRARRLAGAVRRSVRAVGQSSPGPTGAAGPKPLLDNVFLDKAFLAGATLVATDCQSMPLAQAMLTAHPGLRVVTELPRTEPVDGAG